MWKELVTSKRLGIYLLINVVVSAVTTLFVIILWMHFTLSSTPTSLEGTPLPSGEYAGQLAISAVIGAGDLKNESVLIELVGDKDLSLAGWRLRDEDGNEYRFPALVLHPGARVTLFTYSGDDTASELYWDRQVAAWTSGEKVSLLDPRGQEQAGYVVP